MTAPTIALHPDREAWLADRWGIGASEIASVVGISPYRDADPYTLWARKTGRALPMVDNAAMAFGRRAERLVLELFAEQTGLAVCHRPNTIARSGEHPWAFASPDALAYDGPHDELTIGDALGVVEAKINSTGIDVDDVHDERAATWVAQVQWQMFVLGLDHGWIAVLRGLRDEVEVHDVERDDAAIEWLVTEGERFWRYIAEDEEPPATVRGMGEYHRFHPRRLDAVAELPAAVATRLMVARRRLLAAEADYDAVKVETVEAMRLADGDSAEWGEHEGHRLVHLVDMKAVDETALLLAEPDLCAKFQRFDLGRFVKAQRKVADLYRTVERQPQFRVTLPTEHEGVD